MQIEQLLAELDGSGRRLLVATDAAGFAAAVPSCPGWTVIDLVSHVRRVHAWALHIVKGRPADAFAPPVETEAELRVGYADGLQQLIKTLRAAKENLDVVTGYPGISARHYWVRRMAQETTMHRLDVELAGDTGMVEVPAAFAADGIDELLTGFASSRFVTTGLTGTQSITVMPLDVNQAWTVTLGPHGARVAPLASDRSDLTVTGLSSDLYRWVWNRDSGDGVSLSGSASLADRWRDQFQVTGKQ